MSSSNDRNSHFWRNVVTGVGVAAAGAAIAFLVKEVIDSTAEETTNASREVIGSTAENTTNASRPPNGSSQRSNSSRRRRNSRGTGEQLSGLRKIITEKLNNGTYECAICLEEINKESKVIACKTCHQICHLKCLRELMHHFRVEGKSPCCPTCRGTISGNLVYKCFCGKETNPPSIPGLTPHTCGAQCGKMGCQLDCHPGPCV